MSTFTRAQFSRKKTLSEGRAMAVSLARYLLERTFPGARGEGLVRFADAFPEWADPEETYAGNMVAIVPAGELVYLETQLTPTLLEDTWEPDGRPGFGLYKRAEAEVTFNLNVRGATGEERSALVAEVEELFVAKDIREPDGEPGILMNASQGGREGLLLDLPEYYGLQGRFTLLGSQPVDNEATTLRGQSESVIRVLANTPHVSLGRVQPFTLHIQEVVT